MDRVLVLMGYLGRRGLERREGPRVVRISGQERAREERGSWYCWDIGIEDYR